MISQIAGNQIDRNASDSVQLAWRFRQGQTFQYVWSYSHYRSDGSTGSETYTLWCTVVSVAADGAAQIEGRIDELILRETGDVEFEFISSRDQKERDPLQKLFGTSVGKPFRLEMRPDGSVLKVRGFGRILWSMLQAVKGLPIQGLSMVFLKALSETYNDSFMTKRLQDSFPILPRGGISEGDEWKKERSWGRSQGRVVRLGRTDVELLEKDELTVNVHGRGSSKVTRESTCSFDFDRGLLQRRREKRSVELEEGTDVEVIEGKLLSWSEPSRKKLSALVSLQKRAAGC